MQRAHKMGRNARTSFPKKDIIRSSGIPDRRLHVQLATNAAAAAHFPLSPFSIRWQLFLAPATLSLSLAHKFRFQLLRHLGVNENWLYSCTQNWNVHTYLQQLLSGCPAKNANIEKLTWFAKLLLFARFSGLARLRSMSGKQVPTASKLHCRPRLLLRNSTCPPVEFSSLPNPCCCCCSLPIAVNRENHFAPFSLSLSARPTG
jgi:hypothetical protein